MIQMRRMRGLISGGLMAVCLASASWALSPSKTITQYIHDRWGVDRGFLGGAVYSISESNDGYLWIGTERGLVRFDGYTFTMMQRPIAGAPPIGSVRGLLTDADGQLWIRLDGSRLLRYKSGVFENLDAPPVGLTAMAADNHGGVLFTGLGTPIVESNKGGFQQVALSLDVYGTVLSMAQTPDGRVWLGTRDDGLFYVDGGRVSRFGQNTSAQKINVLLPTPNGGVWVGTDNGLYFIDRNAQISDDLPASTKHLQFLALYRDRQGNVWAGTDHGALRIAPDGSVAEELSSGTGHEVSAIYGDEDGDIWLGGGQGIERLRDGMFTPYSADQGLPAGDLGPIYIDGTNTIWMAPLSGGLYCMANGRAQKVNAAGLNDDVVYSISGGGGEIWVGRQHGGLTELTRSGDSFTARTFTRADGAPQDNVFSVHRNRDGTVWAGSVSAGVTRVRGDKLTTFTTANGLSSNAINSIVEAHDGTMWFATSYGLDSFKDGQWANRQGADGLPSSDVRTVFEDSRQVLWVATSGGLAFVSAGKVKAPANLPESLREQVFGIAEDQEGFLWFATSDHVVRVNQQHLVRGSLTESDVQTFGPADGLQGIETVRRDRTMATDNLGRVWISLNGGLAVADPQFLLQNSTPVKVRIESMLASGIPVALQAPLRISAGNQSVTLNFAGTSLAAPERVRFRYKLDGTDGTWSDEVAFRQVLYRNLGPGSYRFRIVASNEEGLWNGPETDLDFVIEPAFWQTLWFRLLIAAFVAATLWIFILYRSRQAAERVEAKLGERLMERDRIARELHDTLLQGFQMLMLRFQVIADSIPEDNPARDMMEKTLTRADHVLIEGRERVRDLRSEPGHGEDLAHNLAEHGHELRRQFSTDFQFAVEGNPRPIRPVVRDEIEMIAREAITNAFRHAQATRIECVIRFVSRSFTFTCRDNGIGIDPQFLSGRGRTGHWGLVGMKERAQKIGASLSVERGDAGGTEIELRLRARTAYAQESRNSFWSIFKRRQKDSHKERGS